MKVSREEVEYIAKLANLKFSPNDIHHVYLKDMIENTKIYNAMVYKETKKIYYLNAYKKNIKKPYGLIAISYKDDEYIMPNEDKEEILRIANSTSCD